MTFSGKPRIKINGELLSGVRSTRGSTKTGKRRSIVAWLWWFHSYSWVLSYYFLDSWNTEYAQTISHKAAARISSHWRHRNVIYTTTRSMCLKYCIWSITSTPRIHCCRTSNQTSASWPVAGTSYRAITGNVPAVSVERAGGDALEWTMSRQTTSANGWSTPSQILSGPRIVPFAMGSAGRHSHGRRYRCDWDHQGRM